MSSVPELVEKKTGYFGQQEIEKSGEAETAVCRLMLSFRRRDGCGPKDAGYVKVKIYFINKNDQDEQDLEIDSGAIFPIRESEKSGSQGEIIFTRMIDPASACRKSLLFLGDAFENGSAFFVDVNLHVPFRILKLEIEDAIHFGRVSRVTTGKNCSGAHDHWGHDSWVPTWSERLTEQNTQNDAAALLGMAASKSVVDIPLRKVTKCDVLRLEMNNRREADWYPELYLAAKLDAERSGPKVAAVQTPTSDQSAAKTHFESPISTTGPNVEACLPDIWYQIVNCLPFDLKLKAVIALSGTCRRFREIFRHPSLFNVLDLKEFAPRYLTSHLLDFIAERSSQLRHMRISWMQHVPDGVDLAAFIRRLPPTLSTFAAEACPIMDDSLLKVVTESQPNIETLDLSRCHVLSPESFRYVSNLPELRRLSLYDTNISENAMMMIFEKCPKLEAINLGALHSFEDQWRGSKLDKVVSKLAEKYGASSLKAVYLCFVRLSNKCLVNDFLTRCGRLEELFLGALSAVGEWNSETYRLLAVSCPRLRRLFIGLSGKSAMVKNSDLFSFGKHLNKLEHLGLVPTDANVSTFAELLDNCPMLKNLHICASGFTNDALKALKEEYGRCSVDFVEDPGSRRLHADMSDDDDDDDDNDEFDEEDEDDSYDGDEFDEEAGARMGAPMDLIQLMQRHMRRYAEQMADEDEDFGEEDDDDDDYDEGDEEWEDEDEGDTEEEEDEGDDDDDEMDEDFDAEAATKKDDDKIIGTGEEKMKTEANGSGEKSTKK